jgi:hypothetical protein
MVRLKIKTSVANPPPEAQKMMNQQNYVRLRVKKTAIKDVISIRTVTATAPCISGITYVDHIIEPSLIMTILPPLVWLKVVALGPKLVRVWFSTPSTKDLANVMLTLLVRLTLPEFWVFIVQPSAYMMPWLRKFTVPLLLKTVFSSCMLPRFTRFVVFPLSKLTFLRVRFPLLDMLWISLIMQLLYDELPVFPKLPMLLKVQSV